MHHGAISHTPIQTAYGCLFCLTGREQQLAAGINQANVGIRATAVHQIKRFTKRGVTVPREEIVLKGYVLFEAPVHCPVQELLPLGETASVLYYTDGAWQLYGEDEAYARWVFKYGGVIRMSRAHRTGDHITIIDGPLKDMEKRIVRMDRRNRSGQVSVTFGGKAFKFWLGYELIEECGPYAQALASCGE